MNELNFYRFVMFWLIFGSVVFGIKQYGDHRVNQFVAKASQAPPLSLFDQTYMTQSIGPVSERIAQNAPPMQTSHWSEYQSPSPINPSQNTNYLHPPVAHPVPVQPPGQYGYSTWSETPGVPLPSPMAAQASAVKVNSWQPPHAHQPQPLPPVVATPVNPHLDTENPMVAEIMRIQRQLGGSQIETILAENGRLPGDLDSRQLFRNTLQALRDTELNQPVIPSLRNVQSDQSIDPEIAAERAEMVKNNDVPRTAIEQLSADERAAMQEHLMLYANEFKARDPQKSGSCKRLARMLESTQNQ